MRIFWNFHGHGIDVCSDCYTKFVKEGCPYCRQTFYVECISCDTDYPANEMIMCFHEHFGLDYCLTCTSHNLMTRSSHSLACPRLASRTLVPIIGCHSISDDAALGLSALRDFQGAARALTVDLDMYGFEEVSAEIRDFLNEWVCNIRCIS